MGRPADTSSRGRTLHRDLVLIGELSTLGDLAQPRLGCLAAGPVVDAGATKGCKQQLTVSMQRTGSFPGGRNGVLRFNGELGARGAR